MRLVKGFLFVSIVLFLVITLFSLLIPSTVRISRATVINCSKSILYDHLSNVKKWHEWHPGLQADGTVLAYCDDPAVYSGKCCDVTYMGKTTHIRITTADSSSIKFTMQAHGDDPIENELNIIPVQKSGQLQVEWRSLTKLHWYPWEKFYGIFIDKIYGPGYETTLESLKKYVEAL
ncbi:SRPBCC family protein [Ferruginibacter sp. SUN002]|uniref:SRPBCC family protein n=1 Tax=Ferruginibacter sp. SUN002 TaxID=2937789 RepID=UPI003D35A443